MAVSFEKIAFKLSEAAYVEFDTQSQDLILIPLSNFLLLFILIMLLYLSFGVHESRFLPVHHVRLCQQREMTYSLACVHLEQTINLFSFSDPLY